MSETVATIGTYDVESPVLQPGNFTNETTVKKTGAFPRLDGEVFPLAVANADVIAPCRWMGGAEVSLTSALHNYHKVMTEENVDEILSDIYEHLANRVTETEEPAEEDRPQEKEPEHTEDADQKSNTKTELPKVQEDSKREDTERQSQKEIDGAEHQEQSASRAEKTSEGSSVIVAEAELVTNLNRSEPKQSTQSVAKAEATASSPTSPANTTSGNSPSVPDALTVTSSTSENSAREPVIDENDQEFRPMAPPVENQINETKLAIKSKVEDKQQIPTLEILEADVVANPTTEARPAPDRTELDADQEIESFTLSVAMEITSEPEPTEEPPLGLENAAILDDATELGDENIEAAEANIVEEEILLDPLEEVGLELDEQHMFSTPLVEDKFEAGEEASILQLNNESNLSEQLKLTSPEQLVQISLTIEEIENSLIQLTQRIKTSEPGTTEKVDEILDEIIDVSVKLETHNSENIIAEAETQEELEELFTELLDRMDIDYTPELIETLASLTLKWHLADEMQKLKNEEETDKAPPGSAAHKVIKKLLAGLRTIKKAIAHACAIGKSALQLYTFNFAT